MTEEEIEQLKIDAEDYVRENYCSDCKGMGRCGMEEACEGFKYEVEEVVKEWMEE